MKPEYFLRDGAFSADGIAIDEIVSAYDTPLYLYSASVIKHKYDKLVSSFPGYEIFYSLKANPSLAVCARLRSYGARADISSMGELESALKAGFEPRNIAFVGPGKSERELEAAVRAGIYAVAVESPQELELIESLSRKLARPVNVLLRVNTLEEPASPEMMVGGTSKFGLDEETLVGRVRGVSLKNARLIGIHVYSASQILDSGFISRHIDYVTDLALRLSDELGFRLECIDFGGGFGVPYENGEIELDLAPISRAAASAKQRLDHAAPGCRLIFEVGRYLIAECGVFLTRVLRVKESRGTCIVITDGGMNHFSRPVFMGVKHAVRNLTRIGLPDDTRCSVGGPICTPIDFLGKYIPMPHPEAGDILGVFDAGAYGYSMSLVNFMSLGAPAEVLAEAGRLHLIRRPKPPGHILEGQLMPE